MRLPSIPHVTLVKSLLRPLPPRGLDLIRRMLPRFASLLSFGPPLVSSSSAFRSYVLSLKPGIEYTAYTLSIYPPARPPTRLRNRISKNPLQLIPSSYIAPLPFSIAMFSNNHSLPPPSHPLLNAPVTAFFPTAPRFLAYLTPSSSH